MPRVVRRDGSGDSGIYAGQDEIEKTARKRKIVLAELKKTKKKQFFIYLRIQVCIQIYHDSSQAHGALNYCTMIQ